MFIDDIWVEVLIAMDPDPNKHLSKATKDIYDDFVVYLLLTTSKSKGDVTRILT